MEKFNSDELNALYEGSDMNTLIKKLVNELREDIEVYELLKSLNLTNKEVKDNIALLTEFKDDYNYCKNCPGIKECDKNIPHIKMNLSRNGAYITSSFTPCNKILDKIVLDSKYLRFDCPEEWKTSTLRNLDLSAIRKQVIKEFSKIIDGNSSRWLYINGKHKTGKSFTLVTFANEFARLNKGKVAVIDCTTAFKDLADLSYSDKDEFSRMMVALGNVDLLLLDNFGGEYKNEYLRDQIVIPLLLEREKNNRLTFFTSDFSIKEIQQLYAIGKNSGPIRARQLADILTSMCTEEYNFNGASLYRK